MPGYDTTGPRTGRGLGRCGRPAGKTTGAEDLYQDEGAWWYDRPAAGELTSKATEDFGPHGFTAGEQESFQRGRIEALLTAELDRLMQMLSEYLRGDAEELMSELDRLKQLLLEYLRGDGEDDDCIRDRTQSELRRGRARRRLTATEGEEHGD